MSVFFDVEGEEAVKKTPSLWSKINSVSWERLSILRPAWLISLIAEVPEGP